MNEAKNKVKNALTEQKKIYFIIIGVMLVGILLGIVFSLILSTSDHTLVKESLNTFFTDIKNNDINYTSVLINSLIGNVTFILLVFILGISIIGMPFIVILLLFKSFIFSFSISSIIYTYHWSGILKAFGYIFPHQIVLLFLSVLLGCYAIYFSKRLFNYLFFKKDIDLRRAMKRYLQVFVVCLGGVLLCSLSETFLSPIIIRLFY